MNTIKRASLDGKFIIEFYGSRIIDDSSYAISKLMINFELGRDNTYIIIKSDNKIPEFDFLIDYEDKLNKSGMALRRLDMMIDKIIIKDEDNIIILDAVQAVPIRYHGSYYKLSLGHFYLGSDSKYSPDLFPKLYITDKEILDTINTGLIKAYREFGIQ